MPVTASIIICTCNRADDLRQTLASLSHLHVSEDVTAEVIVVDNASTDHTADVVRSCELPAFSVHYVHEARRGKGNAYNAGIAAAQGEILLFTDDDVRLPPEWIDGMCAPIVSGKADAVAGAVKIAPHLERPWMTAKHRAALASTEYLNRESPQELVAANMAFSRKVLSHVPCFDAELGPGALGFSEDTLFAQQLLKAGLVLTSAFDMVAEHHPDQSRLLRASYLERAEKQGRSSAYIYYHWHHRTVAHPYLALLRHQFTLSYLRAKRRHELTKEGCPEWEMALLEAVHFCKQYLIERKRTRNYEKHGLRKVNACQL
jgi:glycosyltransferase involved in cell wall biosynthesis